MYQIKTDSSLTIEVIGDLCRIVDASGFQKFAGNYEDCLEWLADRGIKAK